MGLGALAAFLFKKDKPKALRINDPAPSTRTVAVDEATLMGGRPGTKSETAFLAEVVQAECGEWPKSVDLARWESPTSRHHCALVTVETGDGLIVRKFCRISDTVLARSGHPETQINYTILKRTSEAGRDIARIWGVSK